MNTPRRLRLWAIATVAALAVTGAIGAIAANSLSRATDRVEESTAPVLVTSQQLAATLAEADSANISVFLSGQDLDRQQRGLYENALSRAARQIESAATNLPDDSESHVDLQRINATLLDYAGIVEVARERNVSGDPTATAMLATSIDLVGGPDGLVDSVAAVTSRAQTTLDADIDSGANLSRLTIGVAFLAGGVLLAGLVMLNNKFRRLLNLPLVAALVVLGVYVVWFAFASFGRSSDLQDARDSGYDSIALTAELQTEAFNYKSGEANAVIQGASIQGTSLEDFRRTTSCLLYTSDAADE